MTTHRLFPTLIYRSPLRSGSLERFNQGLLDEAQAMALDDQAGRRWSAKHYLGGYTSYGSLAQMHRISSTFAALERAMAPHAKRFARELGYDMRGRAIDMTDCWVNIMPARTVHSLHLHPLSFISGTYYVQTPPGSPALKFEDPRLSKMMAAPPRQAKLARAMRSFVEYPAEAGSLILFESWLRHEVPPGEIDGERVSISVNYAWRDLSADKIAVARAGRRA
ncbi:MAG: TIGR02466 family protein [Reyranellaceae bacterium]